MYYDEHYFNKYHREYSFAKMRPYFSVIARALVGLFKPQQVLDVGCARGYLVHIFRELGVDCWGIDLSEYALSSAPEEVQKYLLKVDIDHEELPFESGIFDLITCLDVVEHLLKTPGLKRWISSAFAMRVNSPGLNGKRPGF